MYFPAHNGKPPPPSPPPTNHLDPTAPVVEILTTITTPSPHNNRQQAMMMNLHRPPSYPYRTPDMEDEDNDLPPPDLIPSMMGDLPNNAFGFGKKKEMVIHSPYLRSALSAVVQYYPGFEVIQRGTVLRIAEPYQVLVHHWGELEEYKTSQPDCHDGRYAATTAAHIDVLLTFLADLYGPGLNDEKKRWAKGRTTYSRFWCLLKPGSVVYREKDGEWTGCVVSGINFLRAAGSVEGVGSDGMLVYMWGIAYKKGLMRREMIQRIIWPWGGERDITSLPVVPERWVKGGVRGQRVEMGRRYWGLAGGVSYKEYEGYLGGGRTRGMGKVIVDPEGYERFAEQSPHHRIATPKFAPRWDQQHTPARQDRLPQMLSRCSCAVCSSSQGKQEPSPWAGFDDLDPRSSPLPRREEIYFMVIGPLIPAFILKERRWAHIRTSSLHPITPSPTPFNHLVLDPSTKQTLKAVITPFSSPLSSPSQIYPWPSDIIPDKGLGRIFLLHGPPGVGKTLTAEVSSLLTRRPLLPLTPADLPPSPSEIETSLSYYLTLSERFGALVLIDEADVYLERRQSKDLRRNSLVSVFLRALEYYKGVMMLTTNRVEMFDDAFTSRIHVALHYKELDEEQRGRVWEVGFDRLERESNGRVVVHTAAREWVKGKEMRELGWNGREIRNGLQTAVALAEFEANEKGVVGRVVVKEGHLKTVGGLSRGFREYMRERKGGLEE
uniref:ATPase family AAA domain-containing protein 3B n=1 Tax=Podospora anserina (strain S / ATCC MYA-4624 / DSM 980 / FGSC 10383) TaxID=515849 RepID=A0A090CDT0_PODAN|nr:Putative ATPase family AAA domain-containing protein 3B [Podospora anserina S mat+]